MPARGPHGCCSWSRPCGTAAFLESHGLLACSVHFAAERDIPSAWMLSTNGCPGSGACFVLFLIGSAASGSFPGTIPMCAYRLPARRMANRPCRQGYTYYETSSQRRIFRASAPGCGQNRMPNERQTALAIAAGFHTSYRPDIPLPPDVSCELESCVPRDELRPSAIEERRFAGLARRGIGSTLRSGSIGRSRSTCRPKPPPSCRSRLRTARSLNLGLSHFGFCLPGAEAA